MMPTWPRQSGLCDREMTTRTSVGEAWRASRSRVSTLLLLGLVLVVSACSSGKVPPTADISTTRDTTTHDATISRPSPGTTFTTRQVTEIEVLIPNKAAVSKVEFYDNDRLHSWRHSPPYSYSWRITDSVNGEHRWVVKLYDRNGGIIETLSTDVRVKIPASDKESVRKVRAVAETQPVPHAKDAADDVAVWLHPTHPSLSTIIGTDKQGGLAVYDLSGKLLHYYDDSKPNNVDIRYNFLLGDERVALVTTSDRESDSIRAYRVDPATRGLEYVSARELRTDMQPYGLCMYNSSKDGRYYTFLNDNNGKVEQWELYDDDGKVDGRLVRSFDVGSTTEGCVADDYWGYLYVSEEDVAIWKYGAEPEDTTDRTEVDAAGQDGRLENDIEGLAIYQAQNGTGYLIASSQGDDTYVVYERQGGNAYVMAFAIGEGDLDKVSYTDGIEVSSFRLGSPFETGLFIAQDDRNGSDNQNFKLVPWGSIATSADPALSIAPGQDPRQPEARTRERTAPVTYYLDSVDGDDEKSGTSQESAWKTLEKANEAPLAPGDRLLLRRGGNWTGSLDITRTGTAGSPITIGSYSSGALPSIQGGESCVTLSGSHLVLEEIQVQNCEWAGVVVSGTHVRIQNSVMAHNAAGVHVRAGATDNKILRNTIRDNNTMSVLTENPSTDDSGAFGVVLRGDRTEVAYNTISGSDAFSYDYGRDGAAVEIYGGRENYIHHNAAIDNDVFSELGNDRTFGNTYAYNVVRSSLPESGFLVTRGDESRYGPVEGTIAYHNTVYLTGKSSKGVVCHAGCNEEILRMRNNILSVAGRVGYADGRFDEDYNLFHGGELDLEMGPHSLIAQPKFVDPAHGDLRLRDGSPGIDHGIDLGYRRDYDGLPVPNPAPSSPDLGAFELQRD